VAIFLYGLAGAIFQQENARLHPARVAQDFMKNIEKAFHLHFIHEKYIFIHEKYRKSLCTSVGKQGKKST